MNFNNLLVVDSTGTNVIFNPGSVVSFQFDEDFISGLETIMERFSAAGNSESGNLSETFTCSTTMTYDDTLLTTGDGSHTKLAFKGLYVMKVSQNLKTHVVKATLEFEGTGGGPVRGVNTILTGTITFKSSGAPQA